MTSTALKTTHSDHAGGNRPWCGTCDSDEFLIFETAAFPAGGPAGELDVSYTCTECEGYYAHQVPAGALDPKVLAGILPVPGDEQPGIYTHCGEPMTLGRPAGRSVASEAAKNTGRRLLEVYPRTRVLHCRCGFQMELPRPRAA